MRYPVSSIIFFYNSNNRICSMSHIRELMSVDSRTIYEQTIHSTYTNSILAYPISDIDTNSLSQRRQKKTGQAGPVLSREMDRGERPSTSPPNWSFHPSSILVVTFWPPHTSMTIISSLPTGLPSAFSSLPP